jgi:hypothetical protein
MTEATRKYACVVSRHSLQGLKNTKLPFVSIRPQSGNSFRTGASSPLELDGSQATQVLTSRCVKRGFSLEMVCHAAVVHGVPALVELGGLLVDRQQLDRIRL